MQEELGSIYIACKLGNISHFVDIRSAYASLVKADIHAEYDSRIFYVEMLTPNK